MVELYRRRWDIETAFKLLKSQLNLFLIWSGQLNVVRHQGFATLILAQVVLAVRNEVAELAGARLREVSLPLLIRWLPELARDPGDPVATLAQYGRDAGIIRPVRGQGYDLPRLAPEAYAVPLSRPPPPRKPRYAGKQGQPGSPRRPATHRGARKHAWGVRQRRLRTR